MSRLEKNEVLLLALASRASRVSEVICAHMRDTVWIPMDNQNIADNIIEMEVFIEYLRDRGVLRRPSAGTLRSRLKRAERLYIKYGSGPLPEPTSAHDIGNEDDSK